MARRSTPHSVETETHDAVMCRRAWRHRRRGDQRRAMLLLREAAHRNERDARLWALYGVQCARAGDFEAAEQALGHAVWLLVRGREPRKAQVIRDVAVRLLATAA